MMPIHCFRSMPSRLLLPVLMLMLLTGCVQFATFSESLFMMDPQQEVKLGLQMRDQIKEEMVLVNDAQVSRYISTIGQKMWANSPQGAVEPSFYVVRDDSLNAFAIPGGGIYVHTGLIKAVDDEAELAAVIAHELGHVIRRHGARQVSRATGLQMVEQILVGESGQATQLVSSLLQSGVMFNYSREDEREADTIAVEALHRAGYDPMAMRSFFAKLQSQSGGSSKMPAFFSTHPPTAERMANVERMVQSLPPRDYQRPTSELNRIRGRL